MAGMTLAIDNLPDDVEALKSLINKLSNELHTRDNALEKANTKIGYLEQLLRIFKHKSFGPSSEHHEGQGSLFNEPEASVADYEPQRAKVAAHERKKAKRKPLPSDLERDHRYYELTAEERQCSCGGILEVFSEEVSEQLDVIPARLLVISHHRKKYSCPCCKSVVKTAALPAQPLPKSNASSGLLAYVATAKYVDHLPLYRQEEIFRRLGIDMPRATLARWMIDLSELLRPLYNLMKDDLLETSVLLMDETPIQVLKGTGKKPTSSSYMWVQCRAGPDKKVVIFHYDPTRSATCAKDLLLGYKGYLVTDGYEAYASVVNATSGLVHCGCWDHARRRFFDAVKAEGEKSSGETLAKHGLRMIDSLYMIERGIKGSDDRSRFIARNLYSRSVVKHLRRWLDHAIVAVPPKSMTGKALSYLNAEWNKLIRYLDDGRIPLSNILAENAIRPFAVGRKNWLFSDTREGAEASGILFSIIETAKANGKEPYAYLSKVIASLPTMKTADEIVKLLPY